MAPTRRGIESGGGGGGEGGGGLDGKGGKGLGQLLVLIQPPVLLGGREGVGVGGLGLG